MWLALCSTEESTHKFYIRPSAGRGTPRERSSNPVPMHHRLGRIPPLPALRTNTDVWSAWPGTKHRRTPISSTASHTSGTIRIVYCTYVPRTTVYRIGRLTTCPPLEGNAVGPGEGSTPEGRAGRACGNRGTSSDGSTTIAWTAGFPLGPWLCRPGRIHSHGVISCTIRTVSWLYRRYEVRRTRHGHDNAVRT